VDILVTYDVSSGHPRLGEVKKYMVEMLGYHDSFVRGNIIYDLPNTTLWKRDAHDTQEGIDDLNNTINVVNKRYHMYPSMRIEKAVSLQFGTCTATPRMR
jgi:hypothetical protein